MEVMIPSSSMEFDFNSARSTPYSTAPSTPKRFGEYFHSAPTSPSRGLEFYRDFEYELGMINESNESRKSLFEYEDEFAFEFKFNEEMEKTSLSAEELFDGGKIKPFKPPPGVVGQYGNRKSNLSPKSPISQSKKMIQNVLSPKHKKHSNPFSVPVIDNKKTEEERGRERLKTSSNSNPRSARSLSPSIDSKSSSSPATLSSSSSKGRKWSLKEFFLFRSASEGRASDKDPLKKYTSLFRKHEDVKNSSFRSTESINSGSSSKRRGQVSAHELHYTKNRAASEDLKKKTFLPYKQSIMGRFFV